MDNDVGKLYDGLDPSKYMGIDISHGMLDKARLKWPSATFNLSASVLKDLQQLGAIEWAQDSLMLDDAELNRMLNDVQATDLASEEFSQAWEPDKVIADDVRVEGFQEDNILRAGTIAAVKDVRERERLLKEAKSEQERQMIRKDMTIFRVSLIFNGEEASLVKSVLGAQPAEKLVEMCKKETS